VFTGTASYPVDWHPYSVISKKGGEAVCKVTDLHGMPLIWPQGCVQAHQIVSPNVQALCFLMNMHK
jgi:hypothetical protein